MKHNSQILLASTLGTIAFEQGKKRILGLDQELNNMFINRQIGVTPKGEASSIEIMQAWYDAWDAANISKQYANV